MELPDPSKTSIFSLKNRPFAPKGSRIVFKASIIKCYCYVSFRVGLYIYIYLYMYIYIYTYLHHIYTKNIDLVHFRLGAKCGIYPQHKKNTASRGVETSRSLPAKRHEGGIRLVEKGAGYPGYRNQRVEFPTNSLHFWWVSWWKLQ